MKIMKTNRIIIVILFYQNLFGQLSVSNLFDYQLGNLPGQEPSNLTTHFDQLTMSYRYNDFLLHGRFEHFQNADQSISFDKVSQWSLAFHREEIKLVVGHFYQIFGRGLLLRTYEIPGVIQEQASFRTRYGYYRDIQGVRLNYSTNWLDLTVLRGRALREDLPPTVSNDFRRENLIEGAQANFYLAEWTLTGIYIRQHQQDLSREFSSLALAVNLPLNIQFYTEYARQLKQAEKYFDLSNKTTHALYTSMNIILGPAGVSLEYKDYNDFFLGFNDPPPLVKEHEYLLLNRSTHNLEPFNERGWQCELFLTATEKLSLVANLSQAENKTSRNRFKYEEKFIEIGYYLSPDITIKGFADLAQEDIRLEKNRYTYGLNVETAWLGGFATVVDLEYQDYQKMLTPSFQVINRLAGVTFSYAPDLSLGIIYEKTSDPAEIKSDWLGIYAGYQYNQQHLLNLFYGSRRGGNACAAGVCYQVLPFEGIELRLTSNL